MKKAKTIKNKIDKTIKKIDELSKGIPPKVISQYGQLKSVDVSAAKTAPELTEVLSALQHNLTIVRKAADSL